ncbi:MAG: hypothetical protein WEE64_06175 [Dehalococcoidia bacterium]
MLRIAALGVLAFLIVGAACTGDATPRYRVTVGFSESVTQADMDEVNAFLRTFDEDIDFLLQESFPPTGVATVETDDPEFCGTVESELEAKPYVREVTCTDVSDETPVSSPDEPVQSTPY